LKSVKKKDKTIHQPALFNRISGKVEYENTYHENNLNFLYHTRIGKALTKTIISRRFISNVYGKRMKSSGSKVQIKRFIEHYNIDINEVKRPLESFRSFNDFFIRELKPGARPVDLKPNHLISPADSRLFIFDLAANIPIPVKGYWYSLQQLVKNKKLANEYAAGWCFIYRLAPCDYHRFCYIDKGWQEKVKRLKGVLNSVHPIALSSSKALLGRNYRELTILHTENFGKVIQIEVGALLVGKVVQKNRGEHHFIKGEEKGWFEFGGSTIIQLIQKDIVTPDKDLLEHSSKGIETLVKIGERTGIQKNK
jgi:phosphatidylserine decarboxylase